MTQRHTLISTASILVLALCADMAQAQTDDEPQGSDAWRYSLGLDAVSGPRFPGSSETRTRAVPLASASYGRHFIGAVPGAGVPVALGGYLLREGPFRLGVGLGADLERPRTESDSPRLSGLGDIDRTAIGTVFASYGTRWFVARANVATDVVGKGEGTRASFDVEGRYSPVERLTLLAGPGLTWADSKYTQKFFGIDATQSANSGLPQYAAGGGLNAIRFTVGADYRLTPHWQFGLRATATSLRGDAENSPITEKKSRTNGGLFAFYRF